MKQQNKTFIEWLQYLEYERTVKCYIIETDITPTKTIITTNKMLNTKIKPYYINFNPTV